MHNFWRAARLALRYRWSLLLIACSSLAVALFWGANLGTVYPIVEVVLRGRSLREWVDESIDESTRLIADYESKIAIMDSPALDANSGKGELGDGRQLKTEDLRSRGYYEHQLVVEKKALAVSKRLHPWIHRYLPDSAFPTLQIVVCLLLIGTLLKSLCLVSNVIWTERVTQLVTFDLRKLAYRSTLRMDLASFADENTSQLMSHFTHDMEGIVRGMRTIFGRAIREPLKIIVCLVAAAAICWRLLLFSLVVTPVAILLINHLAKSVKRANRRAMEEMSQLYSRLSETLGGIQTVKAYTMERQERRRFHDVAKTYSQRARRIAFYNVLTKASTEVMSIGVVCVAILAGGYLVLNGETHLFWLRMSNRPLTFGTLMAFFALLAGVSDPFRKLSEVYNTIQQGAAAADRIYALVDREPRIADPATAKPLPVLEQLTLAGIEFSYVDDCPVLSGVDLQIEPNETLAIVGPNGCGKSSLIKLLPRFYDPIEGRISWSGVDLRDVRVNDLRDRIGVVAQQSMLFDDTVLANIRYGNPSATKDQVISAAKKAHAHEFIESRLADGYETEVGQGGQQLSGGQRQRIALARAILRDPELLILDEATSQVDLHSERLIHKTLEEFTADRMTIMITHRLDALQLADRILVLDQGQIVDLGTHAELLSRCHLYQRLQSVANAA